MFHEMTQQAPPFAAGGPNSWVKLDASFPSAYRVIGSTGGRLWSLRYFCAYGNADTFSL